MFGEGPEAFDAVDMDVFLGEMPAMGDGVVFAVEGERVVAAEGIGVIDRSFAAFSADDFQKGWGGYVGDHPGVDPASAQVLSDFFCRPGIVAGGDG